MDWFCGKANTLCNESCFVVWLEYTYSTSLVVGILWCNPQSLIFKNCYICVCLLRVTMCIRVEIVNVICIYKLE